MLPSPKEKAAKAWKEKRRLHQPAAGTIEKMASSQCFCHFQEGFPLVCDWNRGLLSLIIPLLPAVPCDLIAKFYLSSSALMTALITARWWCPCDESESSRFGADPPAYMCACV